MRSIELKTSVTLGTLVAIWFLAQPSTRADVTISYSGSMSTSAGLQISDAARANMEQGLDCTIYFKGHRARTELGNASAIFDLETGRMMLVNKITRRYMVTKLYIGSMEGALTQVMRMQIPDAEFRVDLMRAKPMRFMGHRCVLYLLKETCYSPSRGISFALTTQQLFATDFPGVGYTHLAVGHTHIKGVPMSGTATVAGPGGSIGLRQDVVGISTEKLASSDFVIGAGYSEDVSAAPDSAGPANTAINISGLMSSTATNPNGSLSEAAAIAKIQKLVTAGKYDDAVDIARSLERRQLTSKMGEIDNQLGDLASSQVKPDAAWGWYSMTLRDATDPADLAHAHLALAQYYVNVKHPEKANDELNAVLTLPGASDDDKARANSMLTQIKAQPY